MRKFCLFSVRGYINSYRHKKTTKKNAMKKIVDPNRNFINSTFLKRCFEAKRTM